MRWTLKGLGENVPPHLILCPFSALTTASRTLRGSCRRGHLGLGVVDVDRLRFGVGHRLGGGLGLALTLLKLSPLGSRPGGGLRTGEREQAGGLGWLNDDGC